ncbi:MAG: hypothetical protein IPI46_11900 [Bacteroidetes bacterium]|nr:hypothetical protein [Bacteroidota bacterium]
MPKSKRKYQSDQNKIKLEEVGVRLTDWKTKATTEQKAELEIIDNAISKLSEEKTFAEEQVQKVEGSITKLIDAKKKDKEAKIKVEQNKLTETINNIDLLIQSEKTSINKKEYQKQEKFI